jgi:hypothetical protein
VSFPEWTHHQSVPPMYSPCRLFGSTWKAPMQLEVSHNIDIIPPSTFLVSSSCRSSFNVLSKPQLQSSYPTYDHFDLFSHGLKVMLADLTMSKSGWTKEAATFFTSFFKRYI